MCYIARKQWLQLLVPIFEENGIFMLGVVFLQSIFEIIIFDKIFLYPIEDIDFLSLILKRYFTSDFFL